MTRTVPITEVVDVNPRQSQAITSDPQQIVAFVPMSAVSEEGVLMDHAEMPMGDLLRGYTYFERGDVLLAKITPCMENGKAAQTDNLRREVGFASTEFHVLRPRSCVDARYLFHAIWNPHFRHFASVNMTGSAGQRRVPRSFFDQYRIPLPPLNDQRRIAAILDKAVNIRRKRREIIRLTDNFLRSVFLEMFRKYLTGDADTQLGALLAEPLTNGFFAKNDVYGGGIPVVWVDNLYHTMSINTENLRRAQMTGTNLEKYEVFEGDLLFTRSSLVAEGVGQINIVPVLQERTAFECHIIRARVNRQRLNPSYVLGLYRSTFGKQHILRQANTATMTTISQGALERLPCPVPPLDLQEQYAKIVRQTERVRTSAERATTADEELMGSLSQRAFKGEL